MQPGEGHFMPVVIDLAFLQRGKSEQLKNFPLRPHFTIIGFPHIEHISSVAMTSFSGRRRCAWFSMAIAAWRGCPGWIGVDDSKENGHMKVRDYLHFDKANPISHTNTPRIFFSKSRVPRTIHSIRNYQYEEWVGKIASERDPKEKPKDRETHGADTVRYLCMINPVWTPVTEKSYELEEVPY